MAIDSLPVLRWSDVTGALTNRTDGMIEMITSSFTSIPSNLEGVFLSVGNNLWGSAAQLVKLSSGVDLTATFGPVANRFAGTIYTSLTGDWMILSLMIVFVLVASLIAVYRGQGVRVLGKRLSALILGLGLFVFMGASSAAHPTTAAAGTPWWITSTVTSVVGQAGGGVGSALSHGMDASNSFLATDNSGKNAPDQLSCRRYLAQLRKDAAQEMKDPVIDSLSRMWEETGLRMWTRAQYGSGDNGTQVFCRVLETRAGVPSEQQAQISNKALGVAKDKITLDQNAVAWYPRLMIITSEKPDSDKSGEQVADAKMIDRMVTMFDTCGVTSKGEVYVRPGFQFINAIQGKDRGIGKTEDSARDLRANCSAVLTGVTGRSDAPENYRMILPGTHTPKVGFINKDGDFEDIKDGHGPDEDTSRQYANDAGGAQIRQLVGKFDVTGKSSWTTLADSDKTNPGTSAQRQNAISTFSQQRSPGNLSDVGGSLVFVVSGLVNLLIWGILFGVMRMVATIMSFLMSAGGLYFGLLVYAIIPDKGGKALTNAAKQLTGMCAGVSILGIIASLVSIIANALMMGLGFFTSNGNTSSTVMLMSISSLVAAPISLWTLKYLCEHVFNIGNPFSLQALAKIMGGATIFNGMKAAVGGLASGAATLVAGGGAMSAVAAATRASQAGMRGGSILPTLANATSSGWGSNKRNQGKNSNHQHLNTHGSLADQSTIPMKSNQKIGKPQVKQVPQDTHSVQHTRQELQQANQIMKNSLYEQASREGLSGSEADERVNQLMRTRRSADTIGQIADDIHQAHAQQSVSHHRQRNRLTRPTPMVPPQRISKPTHTPLRQAAKIATQPYQAFAWAAKQHPITSSLMVAGLAPNLLPIMAGSMLLGHSALHERGLIHRATVTMGTRLKQPLSQAEQSLRHTATNLPPVRPPFRPAHDWTIPLERSRAYQQVEQAHQTYKQQQPPEPKAHQPSSHRMLQAQQPLQTARKPLKEHQQQTIRTVDVKQANTGQPKRDAPTQSEHTPQ
ncbi:hypothetical protein BOCO_0365 [Bombiscardovia coagulans]|uniref:Uncharacterized protein n=1 Tax=Bombiscardovia coagulans TaxID=686666 RepID=A0A261ESM7_9BIFI|nr:hypothetical protein BOCO_0365 [Bombiscardovia coagulans]